MHRKSEVLHSWPVFDRCGSNCVPFDASGVICCAQPAIECEESAASAPSALCECVRGSASVAETLYACVYGLFSDRLVCLS
jgi:hypothetical protein